MQKNHAETLLKPKVSRKYLLKSQFSHQEKESIRVIRSESLRLFTCKLATLLCYPIIATIAICISYYSLVNNIPFGLVNVLFLFFVIAYFGVFERIIPYNRQWNATLKEWARDGAYLIISMLGGGLSVAVIFFIATIFSPKEPSLPMAFEVLIAISVSSLGTYFFHRLGHDWHFLWRFHGIHHAESKVNVGNNLVNHILDVFGRRLLAQTPILFIGISEPALFLASIFNIMQGYFVHANVAIKMGPLNYIIGTPEQHRLHHSKDVSEAGHYCVDITLWDWVFGSYTWRPRKKPLAVGINNPSRFPSPNAIIKSFLHPFKAHS